MSKHSRLRVDDVRRIYRLIGECRDLGHSPALWFPWMLQGISRLVGADAAVGGEGKRCRPHRNIEVLSVYDTGFDSPARDALAAYHRELTPNSDPIFLALKEREGKLLTHTRRELLPDADWYRSPCFEYHRSAGVDHQLTSVQQRSCGRAISVIALHRELGQRDFTRREEQMLQVFHGELGPLIGRALVPGYETAPEQLPRRLRETLTLLLRGDSEKQIAAQLKLSPATVHQYVTALYRRFGVTSRAGLMAHALRRLASGVWTDPK